MVVGGGIHPVPLLIPTATSASVAGAVLCSFEDRVYNQQEPFGCGDQVDAGVDNRVGVMIDLWKDGLCVASDLQ